MDQDPKPKDWFSIEYRYTVSNPEELFQYLTAASFTLLEEADLAYERSLVEQPFLAKFMLNEIGVKTDAKSR